MSNEVRITDPKTGGQKGSKPERFSLIPAPAMEEVARVYAMGAAKYEANNYLKGYNWSLSIDALERHIAKFKSRQDQDDESKLHHLAHAVFHCNALMMFGFFDLGTDDRWVSPSPAPAKPVDPRNPLGIEVGDTIQYGYEGSRQMLVKRLELNDDPAQSMYWGDAENPNYKDKYLNVFVYGDVANLRILSKGTAS